MRYIKFANLWLFNGNQKFKCKGKTSCEASGYFDMANLKSYKYLRKFAEL